jgi:vitamin B12 transporter
MKYRILKWVCLAGLVPAAALAVEPASSSDSTDTSENVIITASRLGGIRSDLLGSSATVLAPIDLENRQTDIVSDVLRDVPGVAVSRAGPAGQFTQIRMRGSESNHTLVLIDGIKASDPFFGEFDFATLLADEGARIEILRGEQSALYGSDAIGGIIQYITPSGAEAPGISGHVEGGSFGTVQTSARMAGVANGLDYAVTGTVFHTGGVPDSRFGSRDIGSDIAAGAGKFSYAFAENFRLKAVVRYSVTAAEVDGQDFNFPPSPTYGFQVPGNGTFKNTALYSLATAEFELLDGRWKNALTFQGADVERDGYGGGFTPAGVRSSGDKGGRERASYVTALSFGKQMWAQTLTGAFDFEREFYQNTDPTGFADTTRRHGDNYGFVGAYDIVVNDRLALGAAVRYDQNYRFENAFTYRVQASYRFDNGFRPHAAAGTGIKNPGFYELYDFTPGPGSFIGNPNLKPEKSEGWEIGADQTLFGGIAAIGATYFNSRLNDEIFTTYVGPSFAASPQNATTQSLREGVEATLGVRIGEEWRADFAYTYLHALQNGQEEVRRAPQIASFNIAWRAEGDRYGANLTVRYNGEQTDYNFTLSGPPAVTLASYTLVNFGADYRLTDKLDLYGRFENLFDAKYEEVYTIRTMGRAFFGGVRARL